MAFTYSRGTTQSLRRKDHEGIGSLLRFLLAPGLGPLTSADVIDRVLLENRDDTLRQHEEAQDSLKSGQARLPKLKKEIAEAKRELKHIKKQHTAWPSDVQCTQRKCELQDPKLPCSCWLHTLPRLRASQGSNLCEANSHKYRW